MYFANSRHFRHSFDGSVSTGYIDYDIFNSEEKALLLFLSQKIKSAFPVFKLHLLKLSNPRGG